MRYYYEHGLPFSEILGTNLDDIKERVMVKGKASLIIIDGGVGEGKTTLDVHVADYLNGKPIDFDKQLAMGGEQFMHRLQTCYEEKLPVCVYDEAGDFNRRGALTKLNSTLNRVFETYRAFKIIVIVSLPNFNVLDNQLFDNKIPRLLLHLRGRTNRQGHFMGYGLHGMLWVRHNMNNNRKNPIKERSFDMKEPNFRGHFLNLPPSRASELGKISTAGKIDMLTKSSAKIDGLLTYPEIAAKIGRSINWTRQAMNRLKLKPTKTIRKNRYFPSDYIDVLDQERKRVK